MDLTAFMSNEYTFFMTRGKIRVPQYESMSALQDIAKEQQHDMILIGGDKCDADKLSPIYAIAQLIDDITETSQIVSTRETNALKRTAMLILHGHSICNQQNTHFSYAWLGHYLLGRDGITVDGDTALHLSVLGHNNTKILLMYPHEVQRSYFILTTCLSIFDALEHGVTCGDLKLEKDIMALYSPMFIPNLYRKVLITFNGVSPTISNRFLVTIDKHLSKSVKTSKHISTAQFKVVSDAPIALLNLYGRYNAAKLDRYIPGFIFDFHLNIIVIVPSTADNNNIKFNYYCHSNATYFLKRGKKIPKSLFDLLGIIMMRIIS